MCRNPWFGKQSRKEGGASRAYGKSKFSVLKLGQGISILPHGTQYEHTSLSSYANDVPQVPSKCSRPAYDVEEHSSTLFSLGANKDEAHTVVLNLHGIRAGSDDKTQKQKKRMSTHGKVRQRMNASTNCYHR